MEIHSCQGLEHQGCQQFLDRHWPSANQQQFGWTDQQRWQKEHFTLWAEEKGEIVGVALGWTLGGVGYLSQLLVAREHRQRGVGSKLMAAFERKCSRCHKLALKTYKNSASQRFYAGVGYRVESVIANDIHGIDWVYMYKEPDNDPAC